MSNHAANRINELSQLRGISKELLSKFISIENSDYKILLRNEYNKIIGRTIYSPTSDIKYLHKRLDEKNNLSFGLENIRNAFPGQPIFVTEGIFDALAIMDAGFISISTLGAKFPVSLFNKLLRYTDKIVVMFDNDRAGEFAYKTALKNIEKTMGAELCKYLYRIRPLEHKDPNECLQRFGIDRFKSWLSSIVGELNG